MKVHPILHSIFEITRSGFIQFLHHCSVSWKITPLYYFSSKLTYFAQKELTEVTLSDFWVVGWIFNKFLMWHLKPQVFSNQNSPNWNNKLVFLQTLHHSWYCFRWSYIKFEEELTCCFKIDTRSLTNFDWSTRKSQKLTL